MAIKMNKYIKVIKMKSLMARVQSPIGLINVEGSASSFKGSYLG
jgi:hypothetical protein